MSLGILVTVISFAIKKFTLCYTFGDTIYLTALEKEYFDEGKEYTFDSFSVAFALVDAETFEPINEVERFAKFGVYQLNQDSADINTFDRNALDTHKYTL